MKSDEEEMLALIKEFNEKWTEELARIGSNFPPDPPNAACHHAVITGLRLTNSTWMNGNPPMLPAPRGSCRILPSRVGKHKDLD